MKKILIASLLVLLSLGLFVGVAAAQGNQPQRGTPGQMHDYMEQALADKLGLTLAQVETQFDAGKSLYQIALDNGIAQADLATFMQGVQKSAFAAMVKDGVLTQAQADQMLQRMTQRGNGTGVCPMGGTRLQNGTGLGAVRGMGMGRGAR